MKRLQLVIWLVASSASYSQMIDKVINPQEVERIEKILSADDMQGRASFSPGIEKAADFISGELVVFGFFERSAGRELSLIGLPTIA